LWTITIKKKHPIKFHLAFWCVTIARLSENLYRIRFGSMIVRTRSSLFVCLLSPAQGLVHHPIPCIHLKIPNFFNVVIIIIELKVLTLEKKIAEKKNKNRPWQSGSQTIELCSVLFRMKAYVRESTSPTWVSPGPWNRNIRWLLILKTGKFTVLQKPNIYYSQLLSFCFYSLEKGTFEINSLGI
jgi:hypothetical protein